MTVGEEKLWTWYEIISAQNWNFRLHSKLVDFGLSIQIVIKLKHNLKICMPVPQLEFNRFEMRFMTPFAGEKKVSQSILEEVGKKDRS